MSDDTTNETRTRTLEDLEPGWYWARWNGGHAPAGPWTCCHTAESDAQDVELEWGPRIPDYDGAPAPVEGGPPRCVDLCGCGDYKPRAMTECERCLPFDDLGALMAFARERLPKAAAAPRGEPVREPEKVDGHPASYWRQRTSTLRTGIDKAAYPLAELAEIDGLPNSYRALVETAIEALDTAVNGNDAEHTAVRPADPPSPVEASERLLRLLRECRCYLEGGPNAPNSLKREVDAALAGHPAAGAPAARPTPATHPCFLGGRTCGDDSHDRCRDCPFGGLS